jgi:hypothetical protein
MYCIVLIQQTVVYPNYDVYWMSWCPYKRTTHFWFRPQKMNLFFLQFAFSVAPAPVISNNIWIILSVRNVPNKEVKKTTNKWLNVSTIFVWSWFNEEVEKRTTWFEVWFGLTENQLFWSLSKKCHFKNDKVRYQK